MPQVLEGTFSWVYSRLDFIIRPVSSIVVVVVVSLTCHKNRSLGLVPVTVAVPRVEQKWPLALTGGMGILHVPPNPHPIPEHGSPRWYAN